jgi:BirA family transcriptional regulator, biotin operon repressor / biotin---[acetyl-CoA-carboxylase] ligase
LNTNTLFVGGVFMEFPELPSTNAFALEYLSATTPSEGTVITTRKQTAGQGQRGNYWESEPYKNISLSIILYPKFVEVTKQFDLSKVAALAVCDLIQTHCDKSVKIKWPNDIYIEDRKVAGILIQNALSGSHIKNTVIGIGININQEIFLSDAPNPTSLKLEAGEEFDVGQIIEELCKLVESWYLKLKARQNQFINAQYLNKLYRFDETYEYKIVETGQIIKGKIIGIANDGRLQIKTEIGVSSFSIKEIKFL